MMYLLRSWERSAKLCHGSWSKVWAVDLMRMGSISIYSQKLLHPWVYRKDSEDADETPQGN
jgi:hypothetical protein